MSPSDSRTTRTLSLISVVITSRKQNITFAFVCQ
nr:MAG TPA: hypothetical protein [Caudoviricetes sp.]